MLLDQSFVSITTNMAKINVNGRNYCLPPETVVVICVDGCEEDYLDVAIEAGRMPNLKRILESGWRGLARGALPSFTNVNNSSIVTGVPPSVTGISGNFFLDPESGEEVMMNSSDFLRCETILSAAAQAGRKVAMVTAKEKLRDLLSPGLTGSGVGGIAFSSERASEAQSATHGISGVEDLVGPTPEIYSGDASIYVLRAGVALVEAGKADFLYLSLTDYIQHKFAPEEEGALQFNEALDVELGRLFDLGCRIGITADHGMNSKCLPDGNPRVIYLEERLSEVFGDKFKVICPITDPYVAHHGALGSYVVVHLDELAMIDEISDWILSLDGISEVLTREEAVNELELPEDRIGDLIVISSSDTVVGRRPEDHDLSGLDRPLRSHGGRSETMVPIIFSKPLSSEYEEIYAGGVRNFDVFDFVCNGL